MMGRSIAEENSMLGAYNWKISRGDEAETTLQGYVKPQFTKPGHTISFHASSELDECQFFLRIYRLGWYRGAGARQVHRSKITSVGNNGIWSKQKGWQHSDKCGDSVQGMNWPRVYQLYIPDDWLPGSYIAKFETLDGRAYIHPFWISSLAENESGIAVLGAVITSQSRNWWGGISATQVVDGTPFKSPELYYPVGSESLSFERPYFNSRGGDALRWEYPLVRWLEKNQVEAAYHTDLELETKPTLLNQYSHVITAGPMRYWTENTELALQNFVEAGGNIVHLGSEAGQHMVALQNNNDYRDGQIVFQPNETYPDIGERLENTFYSATVSGSRKTAPWANLKINSGMVKHLDGLRIENKMVEGIAGLSWDKSIKANGLKIVASNRIKHRKWTYRVVNSHVKAFSSGGSIFNAGVSSWSWGLEKFGNHGNANVNDDLQEITLRLLGIQNKPEIKVEQTIEEEDVEDYDLFTLEDFNIILQENPRHFEALLGAGIFLWEEENYDEAHTYFERALQVNPDSIIGKYRLARNHHKLQQYHEMIPIYEYLLRECPERMHYVFQYADLLINLQRFDDAILTLQQLKKENPQDSKVWAILAHCERRKRKFSIAEKYCKTALELDPGNHRARVQYASIAHDQEDYIEAEKRWEDVLKIDKNNYSALMGKSRGCFKRGAHELGQKMLEQLVHDDEHSHRVEPYISLMNLTFNYLKDYSYTTKVANLMLTNLGSNIQLHKRIEHIAICHLTLSLSKLGNHAEAEKICKKYLNENPENDEYRLCLTQILREAGEAENSLENFKAVFENADIPISGIDSMGERSEITVECLTQEEVVKVENGPLVSIIMTAYKATELIEIAVNSILQQSYQNIELIIVDDASPDDTFEKILSMANNDSRIKPLSLENNGGTYVAKNSGLQIASGKYVSFHDSDDWCHQDKIKIQVESLESDAELIACTTGYIRVDENSNIIYRGKGALRHACISLMFEREKIVNRIGFFDSIRVSADSEYEARISTVFGKEYVSHLHLPLIVASVRSESLSQGGKFQLDWMGLSGPRLEYRQQYQIYHREIILGAKDCYIPFPLEKRVFDAPSEMIW
uniref:Glycosyl transferase n=1 Tax=uncultured marine group II/III euryarchaeote KM3_160_F12 TaxID=1457912 RepID=A0A075GGQ1_9EURY|nr:glycosyl transferase [uncultured marine group II/III euryarchaeote KM3_160_F12]